MLCWSEKLSRIKNVSSNLAGSLLFICDLYCKKNESKIEVNNKNILFGNLAITKQYGTEIRRKYAAIWLV